MSRTNSLGRYTQSIRAKDICILLMNADYICRNIVADMLDQCRYEAFSYEREMDALNIILEKKDAIELILTNIHRTYASRLGIIERIEKEFKLQIILMSPDVDDIKNASRGGGNGVTVYFMKSLSVNEMNHLWATALAREKGKNELSSGNLSRVENAGSKGPKEDNEQNGNSEKKPRVVWTKEMHQKFLEAVEQLGHDKPFPKKIVELMNVPGLTRENVASHLQKYRMCMKRAQEGFTTSSYDFNDLLGFNTSQENFQQSHWNPFLAGSRNTTTTNFGFSSYRSTSRTPQHISLLNTIRLKPDHNFRVYGDEKKNVLLSVEGSRLHPNTSFAGFRLAHDGKSVVFGQNSHFGNKGVTESYIQSTSASSVQQQPSFPEMGNDNSNHCPLFIAPPVTGGEPARFSSQLSSLAALLAIDEPMPAILTQPQASAAPAPPGFDWNKAATFIQSPSTVAPPWLDWEEPLRFTCQQSAVMAQPQSAELQWTDHWAELPSFSPQQQVPSGNTANANSDIFSDFSSSLPPEFCELGPVGDANVVDATEISIFDDLLFDNQDLT